MGWQAPCSPALEQPSDSEHQAAGHETVVMDCVLEAADWDWKTERVCTRSPRCALPLHPAPEAADTGACQVEKETRQLTIMPFQRKTMFALLHIAILLAASHEAHCM